MISRSAALLAIAASALSACSSTSGGGSGTLVGSFAASPQSSSSAIAAAMGTGLIGRAAPDLGRADLRRALEAEYRALEYSSAGQVVPWSGGSAGLRGEVVAYQPYRVGSQDCRQYAHSVYAAATPQTVRGTACRNADGSWSPLV